MSGQVGITLSTHSIHLEVSRANGELPSNALKKQAKKM